MKLLCNDVILMIALTLAAYLKEPPCDSMALNRSAALS